MSDVYLQKSIQLLTEFCVFLSLIFTMKTGAVNESPTKCHMNKGGGLYMGSRNVTNTGKACQPWAVNSPHTVSDKIQDVMFPDGSKEAAKNFCRNPDIGNKDGVWCYTVESTTEWEFCDVCPNNYSDYNACVLSDKGAGYQGLLTHTKAFQVCLPWKENEDPTFKFPDGSAEDAKNYCRNPNQDIREAPWCFIVLTSGVNWDYCDVCKPFEGKVTQESGAYNSLMNQEIQEMNGLACLHWCITMGYCWGVGVTKEKMQECWYIIDVDYAGGHTTPSSVWDTYTIYRSCRGDTQGKKYYSVDFSGVKTENTEFASNDATIDECLAACVDKPNCRYAEMNTQDKSCSTQSNFSTAKQVQALDVITRYPVFCDPSSKPSEDVVAELNRQNAKGLDVFAKTNMMFAGAAVGIVVIGGGLVCYMRKGKSKGKKKGKHKSKRKGKHKDKRKRKRKK